MKMKIKSNIALTDSLKNITEEQVSIALNKFGSYIEDVIVKLTVNKKNKRANSVEILATVKGGKHRRVNKVTATAEDMYEAINLAADKMESLISKHKDKLKDRSANEPLSLLEQPISYNVSENDDIFDLVKIKEFHLDSMFFEDAVLKMKELNHNFFVYVDAETNKVSIVYARNDGQFGLIETNR